MGRLVAVGSCAGMLIAVAVPAVGAATIPTDPATILRAAIALGCEAAALPPAAMAARLPGALDGTEVPLALRGAAVDWRRSFRLANGGRVLLDRLMHGDRLEHLMAEYDAPDRDNPRPQLLLMAGPSCAVESGRRMSYDAHGEADAVDMLDADLAETGKREILTAAVPPGKDPGGVTVALVDTGVNYLLPEIAGHLARTPSGEALGYDFWAMDARPFDRHPTASPFFPEHHGTLAASVLLQEAPHIRLIPYRYPRPRMDRFAALVDDAARKGARVLSLSLGSDLAEEWQSFAEGVRRHPELLVVVSAGNDGRDLDRTPVYPAALALPNQITVTAAGAETGRPAPDANWGRSSVDLAVPAEDILATGFDGALHRISGSSFAAPRVAALAARLLDRYPGWDAAELKAAIFSRAVPVVVGGEPLLREGYIAEPGRP